MKKKIMATLLALVMCLSLLPTVAFAGGGKVAKIGDTEYYTLESAITAALAANDGVAVELLSDI